MADLMQTVAAMACIKSLLMIFNLAFWVSLGRFPQPFSSGDVDAVDREKKQMFHWE